MSKYLEGLREEIREYFKILSPEFPEWLLEYIETPEMQRIGKTTIGCGTDYSKVFNVEHFHSNLEHSVGVALIVWNFTKDKKQTLAGLFHDISTPVFKHVIDFLNNDHENQESTEEKTTEIIKNSKQIMDLLNRDGIKLEEVNDYKLYPIADNNTPQLSADRFEYTFSSGLIFYRVWELDTIKECYNNVTVLKNEKGIDELGFKDLEIAEKYIAIISKLWPTWVANSNKVVMQFLADIVKSMNNRGYLTLEDLYTLSEEKIINIILNCEDKYLSESFKKFQAADVVFDSDTLIEDKYCVSVKTKTRYIVPLVQNGENTERVYNLSETAKQDIDTYLAFKTAKYGYFDFDFKPELNIKEKSEQYARQKHKGQIRKLNNQEFIYHPLAVGDILEFYGYDAETVSAGYLHDVVEDTQTTIDEIRNIFGKRISELVYNASEPDKSLSWEERKLHTMNKIKTSAFNDVVIIIADKIHNLEDLTNEIKIQGLSVFNLLKRGIDEQLWYFEGIYNSIDESNQKLPIVRRLNEAIFKLKREIAHQAKLENDLYDTMETDLPSESAQLVFKRVTNDGSY